MIYPFKKRNTPNWKNACLFDDLSERLIWIKEQLDIEGIYVDLQGWETMIERPLFNYDSVALSAAMGGNDAESENRRELADIYRHTKDLIKIQKQVEYKARGIENPRGRLMWLNNQLAKWEELELEYITKDEFGEEIENIKKRMEQRNVDELVNKKEETALTVKVLLLSKLGFFELEEVMRDDRTREDYNKMMGRLLGCSADRAGKLCRAVRKANSSPLFPAYLSNIEEVEKLLG
ncbi:MAG: hypothetical protein AAFP77_16340 [Bacteroidota bacterium]